MGALLPFVGKAPAVANPAEKAEPVSSLETFLITSILDTICLPLGGFSAHVFNNQRRTVTEQQQRSYMLRKESSGMETLTPHPSMGSNCSHLSPRLSSCFRVEGGLKGQTQFPDVTSSSSFVKEKCDNASRQQG